MSEARTRQRLTSRQKAALFEASKPIAYERASAFANCYKLDHSIACQDSISALALVVSQWNDSGKLGYNGGCKPSSWIYKRITWDFMTRHRSERFTRSMVLFSQMKHESNRQQDEDGYSLPGAKPSWIARLTHTLGEDATILVNTIIHAPKDLYDEIMPRKGRWRKRTMNALREYFNGVGWSNDRMEQAWDEVEEAIGWMQSKTETARCST